MWCLRWLTCHPLRWSRWYWKSQSWKGLWRSTSHSLTAEVLIDQPDPRWAELELSHQQWQQSSNRHAPCPSEDQGLAWFSYFTNEITEAWEEQVTRTVTQRATAGPRGRKPSQQLVWGSCLALWWHLPCPCFLTHSHHLVYPSHSVPSSPIWGKAVLSVLYPDMPKYSE